jgi:hypothetical protein
MDLIKFDTKVVTQNENYSQLIPALFSFVGSQMKQMSVKYTNKQFS